MSTDKLHVQAATREQLLALPFRSFGVEKLYDSLLIFATDELHDSGWKCIAIVGCVEQSPVDLITQCSDDVEWRINPAMERYGPGGKFSIGQFRSDCSPASGALHLWTRERKWRVGMALSSIEIELL